MEPWMLYLLSLFIITGQNVVHSEIMIAIAEPGRSDIRTAPLSNVSLATYIDVDDAVTSIEFDNVDGRFYLGTGINIFSTGTNGKEKTEHKLEVTSMSIDSQYGLLFYTSNNNIGVLSLYEHFHKIIINDSDIKVGEIAVDADNKHIYWINKADNTIERNIYNGSSREMVVETKAKGLVLDTKEDRLYYGMDGMLIGVNLNGKDEKIYYNNSDGQTISSLHLYDGKIYMILTNGTNSILMSYDIKANVSMVLVQETAQIFSDVVVYNTVLQDVVDNECTVNYGDCNYFCLPLPNGKTCITPDGKVDPIDIEIVTLKPDPTITRKPEIPPTQKPEFRNSINGCVRQTSEKLSVIFISVSLYVFASIL
ncbi:hypothetical protein SNE40_001246 [Patella caerulea]|uniref:Uncharacterized protein n=1 Tax=Patella caerulea TaxID=87958 RepID=A0AAN8KE60_PATCE